MKEGAGQKNLLQRIALFLITIPAIIFIIFLAPGKGHWPLNALLIIVSAPSAFEASRLFGMDPRRTIPRTIGVFFNGITFPLLSFLWVLGIIDSKFLLPIYTSMVMLVLLVQVFHQQDKMERISPGIGKHLAVIAYPGLFMAHLIMISKIPNASFLYLTFLIGVVVNDTMAYLTGQLYKKYHDHPTALSPNQDHRRVYCRIFIQSDSHFPHVPDYSGDLPRGGQGGPDIGACLSASQQLPAI